MAKFIKSRNCVTCTSRNSLFNCLTSNELARLNENRSEVSYKAGEVMLKQGTPATHFLCLTSGMAKIFLEGYNERSLIIGIVKPVEYIFGPGIYVDNQNHYSAAAIEDSTACLVDTNSYKELIRTNPDFAESFLKRISIQTIWNFEQFINITQKQMPGKVADVLFYLSEKVYESNPFHITLSRQDLADLSCMSKESVIRILKEFKDENLIKIEGDIIEILNIESLRTISERG